MRCGGSTPPSPPPWRPSSPTSVRLLHPTWDSVQPGFYAVVVAACCKPQAAEPWRQTPFARIAKGTLRSCE